ncbi:wall-associated receptor kinase 3-like [Zingiber officinale]|uniref:wall-associated receptor kinase 3-like n=1 Tax=Zingiber officinale TaxID=94328 RepID=UPI001C4C814E|nr:wall-associated receptor kinase 3-like [Zingiber officinale]
MELPSCLLPGKLEEREIVRLMRVIMKETKPVICICHLLPFLLAISAAVESTCTRRCGDVDIPFPFGIEQDCFLSRFHVVCNSSKLYYGDIQILNIYPDASRATRLQKVPLVHPQDNNNSTGVHISSEMDLTGSPFRFSEYRNNFAAVGCNVVAFFNTSTLDAFVDTRYGRSCAALCNDAANYIDVINGSCSGADGCCQIGDIPWGMQQFTSYIILDFAGFSGSPSQNSSCLFSTLVDRYSFNASSDLRGCDLYELYQGQFPVAVDWSISNASCEDAKLNPTTYACRSRNSYCNDPFPGYSCSCNYAYEGNIFMIISASAGGSVLICSAIVALWRILKKRNLQNRKKKFYRRNLDLLKKEQSSTDEIVTERMKIYELDELEKATNYFDKTRVVGGGGHGKVYKGILLDQRVVAIKMPKITNESELGQFINEVFILSQTNHRNVVKFMGCCLETEVPLLVFEFISGGTLSDHLLNHEQFSPLSFEDRLRIAYEVARALSYIHSEASITIFHRDVKSSNILLDERNIAKLADFGASRAVTCDTNSVTTIVQGTYGYLDPEYHQTGRLTDKSDVYSFGVILAELLTGTTAIPYQINNEVRHLVMDFIASLKDNSLPEILDPLVLEEAKEEILGKFSRLIERCLKLNGTERPTMKEVEEELEAMRAKKPKASPNGPGVTASCLDLGVNSLGGTSAFFYTCLDLEANSLEETALIDSSM